MRLAARSTVIVGALASFAIASPLASARFNLEPATSGQTTTAVAPAVVPNPDQQVTQVSQVGPPALRSATGSQLAEIHRSQTAASHALASAPTASARYSTAALNGYVAGTQAPAKGPGVVHVTTHSSPFDWGAAAIGALGGLVVALLVLGGGVLVSQRREPKPTRAKALA